MHKIFILTEGGGTKGMGHISRCLSLCQAFQEYGADAMMIVDGEGLTPKIFEGTTYIELDWINRETELLSIVNNADLVIIDSYICPLNVYQKLASVSSTAAYIDDEVRVDYPEGIVINGVICAGELPYPKKNDVTYLLGQEYSFFRKEFWEVPGKTINEEVQSVMITCGGNDEAGLSYRIVRSLRETYPSLELTVILKDETSPQFSACKEFANVVTGLSALEMRELMAGVDIAITASGQTTYELCRLGTPFIAIVTANNQLFSISHFLAKKLIQPAILSSNPKFEEAMLEQFETLADHTTRKNIHHKMKQTFNGQGSLKVADYLLNILAKK